jgi:hypothetical protein
MLLVLAVLKNDIQGKLLGKKSLPDKSTNDLISLSNVSLSN